MFTDLRPEKLITDGPAARHLGSDIIKVIDKARMDNMGRLDPRDALGALAAATSSLLIQCYFDNERKQGAYVWWQVVLAQIANLERVRK